MSYAETGQINVLVIDDDPEMRDFITQLLLPEGHQIISVDSAEKGLEQLPYQTFDVAFIDQQLPGMDGLVFGTYLQKNNPHMKIALVTGHSAPKLQRISAEHDIAFIEKPFKVEELLEVIEKSKQHHLQRQLTPTPTDHSTFHPVFLPFFDDLHDEFGLPEAPVRIQKQLFQKIRDTLSQMRISKEFSEQQRATVLAGLLAAQLLGVKLSRFKDGKTPFEVYDELMLSNARRTEFTPNKD